MPCNFSLDLMNPSFLVSVGSHEKINTTILNYNGTIVFTFFAVNGAGNGNATSFTLIVPKRTQEG